MSIKEHIVRSTMSASSDYIGENYAAIGMRVNDLLNVKGKEYSTDENRLENFIMTSQMENITPEQALWNFMTKHVISIKKFINDLETDERYTCEKWDEKILDIITYLVLLRVMTRARCQIESTVDKKRVENERETTESPSED